MKTKQHDPSEPEAVQLELDTREREIIEFALTFLRSHLDEAIEEHQDHITGLLFSQAHLIAEPTPEEIENALDSIVGAE